MSSSEDFQFSLTTIDDDLPSPPPYGIHSAAESDFLDDFLMETNLLGFDHTYMPPFDSDELDRFSDAPVEGFDKAQSGIFDGELPTLLAQCTLTSEDHSNKNECEVTESTGRDSRLIETSNSHSSSNSVDITGLQEILQSLRLVTPPAPSQRVRYKTDLLCETTPIYQYEFKKRNNLPAYFGTQRKRLQHKRNVTKKKRAQLSLKQTQNNRLKGLIRTTNPECI